MSLDTVRDLLDAHAAAPYPVSLAEGEEVDGVVLVLLDADVAGLATAFLASGGTLRADQWWTLRECAADARSVVPRLSGEAWVHFGRLYALAQAVLRHAPGAGSG